MLHSLDSISGCRHTGHDVRSESALRGREIRNQEYCETKEKTSILALYQIPVPKQMDVKGDVFRNWAFFRSQWESYEIATGLSKKENNISAAMLLAVMDKGSDLRQWHLGMAAAEREVQSQVQS